MISRITIGRPRCILRVLEEEMAVQRNATDLEVDLRRPSVRDYLALLFTYAFLDAF